MKFVELLIHVFIRLFCSLWWVVQPIFWLLCKGFILVIFIEEYFYRTSVFEGYILPCIFIKFLFFATGPGHINFFYYFCVWCVMQVYHEIQGRTRAGEEMPTWLWSQECVDGALTSWFQGLYIPSQTWECGDGAVDDALGSSPSQAGALVWMCGRCSGELGLNVWRWWCRITVNGEPCKFQWLRTFIFI